MTGRYRDIDVNFLTGTVLSGYEQMFGVLSIGQFVIVRTLIGITTYPALSVIYFPLILKYKKNNFKIKY